MKQLLTTLLVLFCLQATAQDRWLQYYSDGRAVILRDSLYGYIDRAGNEVIPCQYTKAYNFNDGMAMVRKGSELFAIDTLGQRLDHRVTLPLFKNQTFASFARWVRYNIPFTSTDGRKALSKESVYALITIAPDGHISACENLSTSDSTQNGEKAFEKVHDLVMTSPLWTAGTVDDEKVQIQYVLPVFFDQLPTLKCWAVDADGLRIDSDLIYPLFKGQYPVDFYNWFYDTFRIRTNDEYDHAASGVVRTMFTIDKEGKLGDIAILEADNKVNLHETFYVLNQSPRWTPGTIGGQPVDVRFEMTFQIRYRNR